MPDPSIRSGYAGQPEDLPEGLSGLVDLAYQAAIDDRLWVDWANAFLRVFEGRGGALAVLDDRDALPERTINLWSQTRLIEEYFAEMAPLDPQLPVVQQLKRSQFYADHDFPQRDYRATRDFANWLRRYGGERYFTAVFVMDGGAERAAISIHNRNDDRVGGIEQKRRLASIFPALHHAFDLAYRQGELSRAAIWDGMLAVDTDRVAILLDERGRVIRMSDAAIALFQGKDGLVYRNDVISCVRSEDSAKLAAVTAAATRRHMPVAGALAVPRPSGRPALIVTVYPLSRARRIMAPLDATALVTMVDPLAKRTIRRELWRDALGLTAREVEMAELLQSGHSPESAAATLEIAMPTARTHLAHIFEKTGTSSQGGLLRLLGRL